MDLIYRQIKSLVELAVIDGRFDKSEELMILAIGKANKVPREEIQKIINAGMSSRDKEEEPFDFSTLTFDEKFEYLYDIIQLMK
ncbi:MAG: hypothetical protein GY816_13775, partial [Cytophagales bacterium]|nr:hypothetical protein [Cytophagales bacterium]